MLLKVGFLQTPNLAFLFKLVLLHYWLFQDMKIKSADSNLVARQEWFDKRKGKYIDTFYYEGEIKTMLRGGGKHLLDGNIEFSSNLRDSQKDLIADEVGDLRKEVSGLKEMIK